jgi:hypothetical protein
MTSKFYIRLDETGEPSGYPVATENLAMLIEGGIVTDDAAAAMQYVPILDTTPTITYAQTCEYAGWSRKEDGTFSMDWTITELSREEVLNKLIRDRRAFELASSDWTQTLDAPLTAEVKAAWATYRQALRDLPATYPNATKPEDVTWPLRPGEPAFQPPQ